MTDQRGHWAQSGASSVPGAPPGVRPISTDAMDHLGVDAEGNLYWLDTRILTTKKEFRLSWFQGALATITASAALVAAIAGAISAYADWNQFEQNQSALIKNANAAPPKLTGKAK